MKLKVQEKFIITFLEQEYQFCLKKNYINKIQIKPILNLAWYIADEVEKNLKKKWLHWKNN